MQITEIKYLYDYKIEVTFSNNQIAIADFENFLNKSKNKMTNKFLDKKKFKKVTIDCGFLSWNDGEMEIDALTVYYEFSNTPITQKQTA